MDDQIAPLAAGWLKTLFNGRVELTGRPGYDDWRITLWSGAQPIDGMRLIITAIEVEMIGEPKATINRFRAESGFAPLPDALRSPETVRQGESACECE